MRLRKAPAAVKLGRKHNQIMSNVTITITKRLEDFWASDEDFARMTDEQILELCQEDTGALLEGANWKVRRLNRLESLSSMQMRAQDRAEKKIIDELAKSFTPANKGQNG